MEIVPAILPKKFSEIEEKVDLVKDFVKFIQIDICDGKFVKNQTWPYIKTDENFEQILREERGMPEWEKVNYEFDLMIKDPSPDDARKWLSAGAERIVLHLESSEDLNATIDVLHGLVDVGVAIGSRYYFDNKSQYAKDIIGRASYIQIMGIEKIGFQGQGFDQNTISTIEKVLSIFPDKLIQIDGGISIDNAKLLKDAGVKRLVVGSSLFGSDNIVDTISKFKKI